jgi:hypothetical protein
MTAKDVRFGDDARQRMMRGVDTLAQAVNITLGPKGRNVILDKSYGAPRITKDGVTVAREIELSDKFVNMGAQMVREAASKTNDVAGDGTTTAVVLAQAIVREGGRAVSAGMNPMDVKRGVDKAVVALADELKKRSKKITTQAETAQVGTISANGETEIGAMIDPKFAAMTACLFRREALRRAAEELNTASPPGLEDALARISAEVTAEAAYQHEAAGPGPGNHVRRDRCAPRPKAAGTGMRSYVA